MLNINREIPDSLEVCEGKTMKKLFLAILILFLLLSCDLIDSNRTVRFYASSTSGLVSGSYLWAGGFNVFSNEPSPWSMDVKTEKDDYVILTVTNSLYTGTVTAKIYFNDMLFREISGTDWDIIQVAGYVE